MKRVLILLTAMLALSASYAFTIIVRSVDGTAQSFDSSQVASINLSDQGGAIVNLNGSEAPVTISAANFKEIAFSDGNSLGSVISDNSAFVIENNAIKIIDGSTGSLYDLNGRILRNSQDGRISLIGLKSGVYVIKTGTANAKFYLQ